MPCSSTVTIKRFDSVNTTLTSTATLHTFTPPPTPLFSWHLTWYIMHQCYKPFYIALHYCCCVYVWIYMYIVWFFFYNNFCFVFCFAYGNKLTMKNLFLLLQANIFPWTCYQPAYVLVTEHWLARIDWVSCKWSALLWINTVVWMPI